MTPFNLAIGGLQKDNMNSVTGLLLALAICKGVTTSGGNGTMNDKDSYNVYIVMVKDKNQLLYDFILFELISRMEN